MAVTNVMANAKLLSAIFQHPPPCISNSRVAGIEIERVSLLRQLQDGATMSALGHKQTFCLSTVMSAFTSKAVYIADIHRSAVRSHLDRELQCTDLSGRNGS
jgi:hypothetical protein